MQYLIGSAANRLSAYPGAIVRSKRNRSAKIARCLLLQLLNPASQFALFNNDRYLLQ